MDYRGWLIMKRLGLILAALVGLAVQAVPASADMVFTLNCNGAPCTGGAAGHNYGTVTLQTVSSTQVHVIVDLAAPGAVSGETFANSSAGFAIAWDLNGGVPDSIAISAATPSSGSFAVATTGGSYLGDYKAAPFTQGTNGDGFNYAIDYNGATGTSGNNKLIFDVTRSTGLVLGDFVKNPNYFFTADIAISGDTFNVASNGPGVKMPEPQTWTLSIAGLAGLTGLVMLQRRRKEAKAV